MEGHDKKPYVPSHQHFLFEAENPVSAHRSKRQDFQMRSAPAVDPVSNRRKSTDMQVQENAEEETGCLVSRCFSCASPLVFCEVTFIIQEIPGRFCKVSELS